MLKFVGVWLGLVVASSAALADSASDCFQEVGDFSRQITACTDLIQQNPSAKDDLADAYISRGHAYMTAGNFDGAITDYTRAIELIPDDATIYDKRARLLGKRRLRSRDYRFRRRYQYRP